MWHVRGRGGDSCINWFRWEKETEAPMSKDSIKTDLEEVRLDGVECNNLSEDSNNWRALVKQ